MLTTLSRGSSILPSAGPALIEAHGFDTGILALTGFSFPPVPLLTSARF
jgi:hypothetical protein